VTKRTVGAIVTGEGRFLVGSRFSDDDGTADPHLREVLNSGESPERIVTALAPARLLVAVVANLDVMVDGEEKDSHMAIVSMVNADGRRGLLAFTGIDSLHRWDPDARPVPATGAQIARAAKDSGDQAVVIDVAGPLMVVLADEVLDQLAGM